MQFYDVINNRTSVRKFKNTPINKDKLARMVNAAMMSPSWRNNTSYRFVLVNDERERRMLSEAIMNDTDKAAEAILQAPMTAVVVANPSESGVVGDREYYLVDCAIALEHFVLSATSEGYGTCWIGAVDENKVRQALSIPNEYKIVAMTPIGEVAENKEHSLKNDVRKHVFLNKWNNAYTENDSQFLM